MKCDAYIIQYGIEKCLGTKEIEYCYCRGDTNKCSFYPEKRNRKKEENDVPIMTRKEAEERLGVKIVD